MPVKVELHRDVLHYLEHVAPEDRPDFLQRLERVRKAPLRESERHSEPGLGRYALLRFTFGRGAAKIAIFAYDPLAGRIRVLKCRLRRPRKPEGPPGGEAGLPREPTP